MTINIAERRVVVKGHLGKITHRNPKTGEYYVEFDGNFFGPKKDGCWVKQEQIKFI